MKRSVWGILLSLTMLVSLFAGVLCVPMAAQADTVAVGTGDYDGNGTINIRDFMAISQFVGGKLSMSAAQQAKMDVFADGETDIFDAMRLFNFINGETETLGGVVSGDVQTYAQLAVETVTSEQTIHAGELVELELTTATIRDLVGLELHFGYDEALLRFVGTLDGAVSVNSSTPVNGELWLTMLSAQHYSLEEGAVLTTLCFEAVTDIVATTDVKFLLAKAVSGQALADFTPLVSNGTDGGVQVRATAQTSAVAPSDTYVTYTIETITCENKLAAGETVELAISASAVADLNGVQLNLCYDDTKWEWVSGAFVGQLSSFSFKDVNTAPLNPMTDKGEVWLSAVNMKACALAEGEVFATITLKALCDIKSDETIGACYSQASSHHGTINGYEPTSAWVNGGVKIHKRTYTGPLGDYFYQNSVQLKAYRLVKHGEDFYFIGDYNKLAKNTTLYLSESFVSGFTYADGSALQAGYYTFDADGKMVIKNGVVGDWFYRNNTKLLSYQLVNDGKDFYFIDSGHKILKNTTIYLADKFVAGFTYADGTALQADYYTFDVDGKMVIKNGVVGDWLYKNNTKFLAYQLVELDGDFYFVDSGHKILRNCTVYLSDKFVSGHTYADGTPLQADNYTFDADGKMVIKNGVVGDWLYKNNTKFLAYQLVELDGDFYFVDSGHKILRNCTVYLSDKFVSGHTYADGTALKADYYAFDADGKMVIKNGVVGDWLYINNEKQLCYQLVEVAGDFYFVDNDHKILRNCSIYLNEKFVSGHTYTDGTPMKAGEYAFGADGKMVIKHGVVGDWLYINNEKMLSYQLVELDGNFYFIDDGHKVVKNRTITIGDQFVAGYTYADGTPMKAGEYAFGADGKMIIKNGVVGDFLYKNNEKLLAYQLVEVDGDFYFVGDAHKVVKNKRFYLSEQYTDGVFSSDGYPIFAGYYTFDENGKMILQYK